VSVSLYLDRDTWIHRLHPVVRLGGMIAIFIASFVVERPLGQLPLLLLLAVLLVQSGAILNVRRLRILFVMIFVMTFLIWTFFYGPDGAPPLYQRGLLLVSRTAPWFALGMAIKLNVLLASGLLFLSVTRIEEFSYALCRLGLPYKVGFTMTMAFRLVPVFLDSALAVVQAQRCRGLDFDRGSVWQRLRRYTPVIVPVFMGALRRADHMAMALEARGFQSARPRTVFREYPFARVDAVTLAVVAGITAAYLILWAAGALVVS
jgi:energy-coupling factor transport system permease protein